MRWIAAFFLIFIALGCKPDADSGNTVPQDQDTLAAPYHPTGAGIWAALRPQTEEATGVILGFQGKEGLQYYWIEKHPNLRPQLTYEGKGLPIPSHDGWKWWQQGRSPYPTDCQLELLDTLGWGQPAPLWALEMDTSAIAAKRRADREPQAWLIDHPQTCDSLTFFKDEILMATSEIICLRRTEWPHGRIQKEFQRTYTLDAATGDTLRLTDLFSETVLQTASGLTARDLGRKWMGDAIPLKPQQLQLHASHLHGRTQLQASYIHTFEISAIEGLGNLGTPPPSMQLPFMAQMDWQEVTDQYLGAIDGYFSPDENLVVIETGNEVWVIDPMDGEIAITLPKPGRLVMAIFGLDHNIADWHIGLRP